MKRIAFLMATMGLYLLLADSNNFYFTCLFSVFAFSIAGIIIIHAMLNGFQPMTLLSMKQLISLKWHLVRWYKIQSGKLKAF